MATVRRLIAAYSAGNHDNLSHILIEVQRSGRGSRVLMAAIIQATDFGEALLGPNFQRWITEAGFRQLDVAKQNQRDLDQD